MTTQVFTNCTTFLGKYIISSDLNALALNSGIDALEKTAMGDSARTYRKGLQTVTLDMEGFYQAAAGLISPILDETYFAIQDIPVTIIPEGYAENVRAYSVPIDLATWNSFGGVGEMMKFKVTGETCGQKPVPGYAGFYGTKAAAATTYSTPLNIATGNPLGSTLFCALHVFSGTAGDTLDVTIQSDDDVGFAGPTDRLAMTQVAGAAGYEWKSLAGTLLMATEDYWRVKMVVADAGGGGVSFSFAVFFGIVTN
jgi:hypothetical protein